MKNINQVNPAIQQPGNCKGKQSISLRRKSTFDNYLTSEEAKKKSREALDKLCKKYGILE